MSNTNAIGLQLGSDGKKDAEGTAGSDTQEGSWAGQYLFLSLHCNAM
jgi:hypothetical protein